MLPARGGDLHAEVRYRLPAFDHELSERNGQLSSSEAFQCQLPVQKEVPTTENDQHYCQRPCGHRFFSSRLPRGIDYGFRAVERLRAGQAPVDMGQAALPKGNLVFRQGLDE